MRTLQDVTNEVLRGGFGPHTDLSEILEYFPEPLHKYIKNPPKYKYGYALIVDEIDMDLLNYENTMPLIRLTYSDYICTKEVGHLRGLRYHYIETYIEVGDIVEVRDNWETSFGEGIYVYDLTKNEDVYENPGIPEYELSENRVAMIVESVGTVEYLVCRVSNDEPKDNEILVLPPHTVVVSDICSTQEELDYWVEREWNTHTLKRKLP